MDFVSITHWLFPPSEDERAIGTVTQLPTATTTDSDGVIALSQFSDTAVRAAIHLTKYHHHPKAIVLLAQLLADFADCSSRKTNLFLPVPLGIARGRERGFNQVTEVLKASKLSFHDHLLVRTRNTAPQTSLTRHERLRNVADAFGIRDVADAKQQIDGQHVVIVDDVYTTGATLKAAAAPLRLLSPASVTRLALAH